MRIYILLLCIIISVYTGCSSTKTSTTLIMFTNEIFPATDSNDIQLYNSRLELPGKFKEIGTIKFEGNPKVETMKKQASEKGATALVLDGNNYILIIIEGNGDEDDDKSESI